MQAEAIGILRGGKCSGGIGTIGERTAHGRVHCLEPALQGIGIVHALHPQLPQLCPGQWSVFIIAVVRLPFGEEQQHHTVAPVYTSVSRFS